MGYESYFPAFFYIVLTKFFLVAPPLAPELKLALLGFTICLVAH